jgi:hypothetical protein
MKKSTMSTDFCAFLSRSLSPVCPAGEAIYFEIAG